MVPQRGTRLAAGDEVHVVTAMTVQDATQNRLRAVSRRGKLARWFGERGEVDPTDQD